MKRLVSYIIMLLCASMAAQAQITLSPDFRDIVRKVYKDNGGAADSLKQAADTTAASLQQDSGVAVPAEESLPCKAVKGALSVFCQQYRLQKGDDTFNRDTLDYYGVSYTLLVKSGRKGFYAPADAMKPWLFDTEYYKDNASGEYTPVLHSASSRRLTEKRFSAALPCAGLQPLAERNLISAPQTVTPLAWRALTRTLRRA